MATKYQAEKTVSSWIVNFEDTEGKRCVAEFYGPDAATQAKSHALFLTETNGEGTNILDDEDFDDQDHATHLASAIEADKIECLIESATHITTTDATRTEQDGYKGEPSEGWQSLVTSASEFLRKKFSENT